MNCEEKKVSIIIPVYNTEEYIGECIASVIGQTYTNLEIIIVDDGSTDHSGEICLEAMKQDRRIQVIRQKNGGLSCAINKGLTCVTGDFVMFVDSDDKFYPFAVEHMINLQKKENADLVIFSFSYKEEYEQSEIWYKVTDNISALKNLFEQSDNDSNIRVATISRCMKLYTRDMLKNIKFPEGRIHEDEMAHEILYRAKRVVYTNEICYFNRIRENSITHQPFSIKSLDKLECFKERVIFMDQIKHNELLKLSCNKFVYLFIQLFCESGLLPDKHERKKIEMQLGKYSPWISDYKLYLGTKARIEMVLYRYFPVVLKKIYWAWQSVKK